MADWKIWARTLRAPPVIHGPLPFVFLVGDGHVCQGIGEDPVRLLLNRHRCLSGFNDFTQILIAIDLETMLRPEAWKTGEKADISRLDRI